MKAIRHWFKKILTSGSEPAITEQPKAQLSTKANVVEELSPTVPDLMILNESPTEIEMSFGFDPYDKADISKK